MIRCAWCGAKNYAIDMWCDRCHRHLDWEPAPVHGGRRALAVLATVAAAVGIGLAIAMPVAAWNGSLLTVHLFPKAAGLPSTGADSQPSDIAAARPTLAPSPGAEPSLGHSSAPTAEPSAPPPAAIPPQQPGGIQAAPPVTVPLSQPARVLAADPVGTITSFYSAVSAHQFGAAAATWSSQMQAQFPPSIYIDQRFANTQYIGLTSNQVVSEGNGSAVVAVTVAEVIGGQNRLWVGTWQLIQTPTGWLLNSPNLRAG